MYCSAIFISNKVTLRIHNIETKYSNLMKFGILDEDRYLLMEMKFLLIFFTTLAVFIKMKVVVVSVLLDTVNIDYRCNVFYRIRSHWKACVCAWRGLLTITSLTRRS